VFTHCILADLLLTTDVLQQLSSSIAYPVAPHGDQSWGQQQHWQQQQQQQWQQAEPPDNTWLQQQQQQQYWEQQRWQHDQLVAASWQQQQQPMQQAAQPQALLSSDRLVRDLQDLQKLSSRTSMHNSSRSSSSSSQRDSQPGWLQAADEVAGTIGLPNVNSLQQQRSGKGQLRGKDKHSIEQGKLLQSRSQDQQQQHGAKRQALPDNSKSSVTAAPDDEDVWAADDEW
jgi:hypothetical protein